MYIESIPEPVLLIFTNDTAIPRLLYYLHVPSMVVALIMGVFIYFKSGRIFSGKMLLYQFVMFFLWCFVDLISWANNDTSIIMFAWVLFYPLGTLTNIFGWLFLNAYGSSVKFSKELVAFMAMIALIMGFSISGHALENFDMMTLGATENIYYTAFYYFFNIGLSLYIFYWLLKNKVDLNAEENRSQFIMGLGLGFYILFFNLFSGISSVLVFTGIDPDYSLEPYGLIGMPVYMGTIAYCMAKYKAFGIQLKETRILITTIIIFIAAELAFMEESEDRWFVVVTLLICVALGYFLLRIMRAEEEKKRQELEEINQILVRKNEEVEAANKELQKLDNAKSEFINIASHQLRSPLTIVKGVASLLVSRKIDKFSDEEKQQFYDSVWSKCLKLEHIIDDILNAASFTNKKFTVMNKAAQSVDVKELLDKIINDLRYEIRERELNVQVIDERKTRQLVLAQKEYLEEAFVNLITNAIKYTPSTKKTDDIREQRNEQGKIKIKISNDNNSTGSLLIVIKDNGIGIPVDELPKLFDRFYRAENARRMYTDGTGLGLFIVKEIIEGHGGTIDVESELNIGTTFTVKLPFIPKESPNIREYIIEHSEEEKVAS